MSGKRSARWDKADIITSQIGWGSLTISFLTQGIEWDELQKYPLLPTDPIPFLGRDGVRCNNPINDINLIMVTWDINTVGDPFFTLKIAAA